MELAGSSVFEVIATSRILPVVVLDSADDAVPLARALLDGGLVVAEVTMRTEAAAKAISRIRHEVPAMLVGAGTVLSADNVAVARIADAQFIVTPGFNPEVVAAARSANIPIVPGINNPTGVEQAMSLGIGTVKFFPAEPSGGVPFLKALGGPYPSMKFIPTGGIGPSNLAAFLALPSVIACGGSWMVDPKLIREKRFDEITRLTAEAVSLAKKS